MEFLSYETKPQGLYINFLVPVHNYILQVVSFSLNLKTGMETEEDVVVAVDRLGWLGWFGWV